LVDGVRAGRDRIDEHNDIIDRGPGNDDVHFDKGNEILTNYERTFPGERPLSREDEPMRRRTLLASMFALGVLLLGGGVAIAAHCTAGVTCFGADGPDTLKGTNGNDRISGQGGSDTLYGYAGDDVLLGDEQADTSRDRDDRLYDGPGADQTHGFGGSDLLVGGDGPDAIFAQDDVSLNPGQDTVNAGDGADTIFANDGRKDTIDCGRGYDTVFFDRGKDVLANCEKKFAY